MRILYSGVIIFISLLLFSCKGKEEKQKERSLELMSARTVGLAYLEENKLEEAEKEFLKFISFAPKEKLGYANLGLVYLRMAKYNDAEKILKKTLKLDAGDPDVRLILATVYEMSDNKERAILELKESLKFSPTHIKTLYNLSELFASGTDTSWQRQREFYLTKVVENDAANIVPRLNLTEIFIRNENSDKALAQLEEITTIFPEFPFEAKEYYEKALGSLQTGNCENALTPFIIFHNYLKVTSPYQAGIMELKGPGGSLIGFPVITFDQQVIAGPDEQVSVSEKIHFTDITEIAGLTLLNAGGDNNLNSGIAHVSACDYDADGDIDLYAGSYNSQKSTYEHFLLKNEMGKFIDATKEAGINHSGIEFSSKFDDFDNDGFPDLFVMKEGQNVLYKNDGKGAFDDVTKKSNLDEDTGNGKPLFLDIDHDGDLDLFISGEGPDLLFRNNGDGTFYEQAAEILVDGGNTNSINAAFGDFDEDGDIDLFVLNQNAENALFSNLRQNRFKNIIDETGLKKYLNSGALAVGDYNNDGFLDLFIGAQNGENHELYLNTGDGKFQLDRKSKEIFSSLQNVDSRDAAFLDFDNDGHLDLIIAGESRDKSGNGVFLFRNNGIDNYENVSRLLPENLKTVRQITLLDYNDDGDVDILLTGINGGIRLLRNDGGNLNHFVKIKLVGLRTGSAKNNYFGIGAKVEMRSGNLYQTKVVTDPNVLFGLGKRQKSDIIRITWTNGVPQNIFFPGSDQSITENQVLKGSCPFLYTWNGKEYTFAKDILWRSALGMPLGIMGGTKKYGFPEASDDYIKIPGTLLKPVDGKYSIQITSELWETIYLDKLRLFVVDHPDSTDVYVDERFSPPPFPQYTVYQVKQKLFPVSVKDDNGSELLPLIEEKDDTYISGFKLGKYQGVTEMKNIVLDLGDIKSSENLYLFLTGWIFPSDASINVALSQSEEIKVQSPVIQAINKKGEWETIINDLGFPMGKDKTIVVNLGKKLLSDDMQIRIRTNMQVYWDQIFFAYCIPEKDMPAAELEPETADLHFRGFSESFRKGGRYGPHWFDYKTVTKTPKWRDLAGYYTRYGDVLPLLDESDSKYIITNAGDEITIGFNAEKLPDLQKGWKRDYLIYSVGWVKDGDLNTAEGNTVEPLPFHGMKKYPYGKEESYPSDPDHLKYLREYNTRKITNEHYIKLLKDNMLVKSNK